MAVVNSSCEGEFLAVNNFGGESFEALDVDGDFEDDLDVVELDAFLDDEGFANEVCLGYLCGILSNFANEVGAFVGCPVERSPYHSLTSVGDAVVAGLTFGPSGNVALCGEPVSPALFGGAYLSVCADEFAAVRLDVVGGDVGGAAILALDAEDELVDSDAKLVGNCLDVNIKLGALVGSLGCGQLAGVLDDLVGVDLFLSLLLLFLTLLLLFFALLLGWGAVVVVLVTTCSHYCANKPNKLTFS